MAKRKMLKVRCPECKGTRIAERDVMRLNTYVQDVFADGEVEFAGRAEPDWDSLEPETDPAELYCANCGNRTTDLRK